MQRLILVITVANSRYDVGPLNYFLEAVACHIKIWGHYFLRASGGNIIK